MSNKSQHYLKPESLSIIQRKKISKFDLFPALPTLRSGNQPDITNICSGMLSMVIFVIFLAIFSMSTNSIVKLEKISAIEMSEMKQRKQQKITNLTISLGIQYLNLQQLRNIFQFRAFIADYQFNLIELKVFPCTRQIWADLSQQKYNSLNLNTHLCLQKQDVGIYGQNGEHDINYLYLNLSICDNATSEIVCLTIQQIDDFITNQMPYGEYFAGSLVILDTGINPTAENPQTFTVHDKTQWLFFTRWQKSIIQTFVGTYQITTDTSFLPYQEQQQINGYFVSESIISTLFNSASQLNYFIEVYLYSSPENRVIRRQFGKIDDVLSYVGGLFGVVISFIGFFMLSYNEYRYELSTSASLFMTKKANSRNKQKNSKTGSTLNIRDESRQIQTGELSYWMYMKYSLYNWLSFFTCCTLKWEDCQQIQQIREQTLEQLDIKYLLKRINHLQKYISMTHNSGNSLSFNNDVSNLAALQKIINVVELPTMQEVRKKRLLGEYYGAVVQGDKIGSGATIQDFQQYEKIEKLGNGRMEQFNMTNNTVDKSNNSLLNNAHSIIQFNENISYNQTISYNEKTNEIPTNQHIKSLQPQHQHQPYQFSKKQSQQSSNSLQLAQQYVEKFNADRKAEQPICLEEGYFDIEKELVEAFYALEQSTRSRIVKKIPICILSRFLKHTQIPPPSPPKYSFASKPQFQSQYNEPPETKHNKIIPKECIAQQQLQTRSNSISNQLILNDLKVRKYGKIKNNNSNIPSTTKQ